MARHFSSVRLMLLGTLLFSLVGLRAEAAVPDESDDAIAAIKALGGVVRVFGKESANPRIAVLLDGDTVKKLAPAIGHLGKIKNLTNLILLRISLAGDSLEKISEIKTISRLQINDGLIRDTDLSSVGKKLTVTDFGGGPTGSRRGRRIGAGSGASRRGSGGG